MDRRTFLGSVIGTLASGKTFYAMALPDVPALTDTQRVKCFAGLFDLPDRELFAYDMYAVAAGDIRFMSPGIAKLTRNAPHAPEFSIEFRAHPINMTRSITILGFGLLLPSKQILTAQRFCSSVPCMPGDTLNITYTASCPRVKLVDFSEG